MFALLSPASRTAGRATGALRRRRRICALRRTACALCLAGIVCGLGLLFLPEEEVSLPVPRAEMRAGALLTAKDVTTRDVPASFAHGFLGVDEIRHACYTRLPLHRGIPIPDSACSRIPPLQKGETLMSLPTTLVPGAMDVGSKALAFPGNVGSEERTTEGDRSAPEPSGSTNTRLPQAASSGIPVILWGFENGEDGKQHVRVAVSQQGALKLQKAAAQGPILLSPAS